MDSNSSYSIPGLLACVDSGNFWTFDKYILDANAALLSFKRGDAAIMADREERRFAEVSRESVRLMAESAGVELSDDVAALLAEDVCYRLREATQVSAGGTKLFGHAYQVTPVDI